MTELSLMFVTEAKGGFLTLLGVGSFVTVQIAAPVPDDVLDTLVGRHVWIDGGWGGRCVIHSWPDLPKQPEEKKNE